MISFWLHIDNGISDCLSNATEQILDSEAVMLACRVYELEEGQKKKEQSWIESKLLQWTTKNT